MKRRQLNTERCVTELITFTLHTTPPSLNTERKTHVTSETGAPGMQRDRSREAEEEEEGGEGGTADV